MIPTDEGTFAPGERLVNWVWYYNVADGSPEMKDIFTAKDGTVYRNTVAQGLVSIAAWKSVRASAKSQMAAPFAELLGKTSQPFVTKINDALCTTARYWDDRVLLVGDALATFRPHMALATEQAANQSLALGKARNAGITMHEWESQITVFAKRIWLLSRVIGELGQRSPLLLARAIFRYLVFVIMLKLGVGRP